MKALRYILILGFILNGMFLSSCDVHEFPDSSQRDISFTLHLDYDTSLPLYKVIAYTNDTRTGEETSNIDIRYIVEVYPAEEENKSSERNVLHRFIFTKDDISTHNHSLELKLKQGAYNFVVWSDYVEVGNNDLYYNTLSFEEITLCGDEHMGSNDLRDAFRGSITTEVSEKVNSATVEMQRPMAKFNFISNDVSDFVSNIQSIHAEKSSNRSSDESQQEGAISGTPIDGIHSVQFSDFNIVFRYNGFMPNTFNAYTNKPSDSTSGVSFESKITILDNGEAELGFDYVFVNGSESTISVCVEVYDYDGELLSRFKPIDVPLVRSHLTTVKANFLTSGTGGVTISPDFDGDYNIQIK